MALSSDLISQFAKLAVKTETTKRETTINGTVVEYDGTAYVRFDGSDLTTPVSTTVDVAAGDRVTVLLRNHEAIITGNITSPSARNSVVQDLDTKVNTTYETLKDEISTLLRIESSRGTVFKNDSVETVLSVVIYRGSARITDMPTLKLIMGETARIQWKWQRLNEDAFGVISADDQRIGADGFTFTLSPDDVDTKITFMCELIVEEEIQNGN